MVNFWKDLNKPFLVMAPMDDVTDNLFRQVINSVARPDVFFTEFVSVDGLVSVGRERVIRKLAYTSDQHPIVAQLWGKDPEKFLGAAKVVKQLGFDGVDINMGCPIREVIRRGSGAGLIGNQKLVEEIIAAVKEGAKGIPVSVKTRLGIKTNIAADWIAFLLSQNITALTLHARTATQMSKGEADWEEIGKAVAIKNEIASETIIIGNGDIKSYNEAMVAYRKYKVDGVMIGRGIFTNPWVFTKILVPFVPSQKDRTEILLKHLQLFEKQKGMKNFPALKKYFKIYVNGFPGASNLRAKLMDCKNVPEVVEIITSYTGKRNLCHLQS